MNEYLEEYNSVKDKLAPHEFISEPKKTSFTIKFNTLSECDKAVEILTEKGIRFRTGKTLVPFRLTGNIEWGVPAPVLENEKGLTIWVMGQNHYGLLFRLLLHILNLIGKDKEDWKKYWCSKMRRVYQFIGQIIYIFMA
jgi:methionyl-tRNA synthetase